MRIAYGQLQVAALQLCAIAHPLDLEPLLIARRDALDHVRDQRAREPVKRSVLAAVGGPRDEQLLAVLLDLHVPGYALGEFPFGAVHANLLALDRHGHAGGHGDGLSTDPGHGAGVTRSKCQKNWPSLNGHNR